MICTLLLFTGAKIKFLATVPKHIFDIEIQNKNVSKHTSNSSDNQIKLGSSKTNKAWGNKEISLHNKFVIFVKVVDSR